MNTNWNTNLLYNSDDDPQIEKDILVCEKKLKKFSNKWLNDNSYLKSPSVLNSLLKEYENILSNCGYFSKPSLYFGLRSSIEQDNTKLKAYENKLSVKIVECVNSTQFIFINLSKLPKSNQDIFLKDKCLDWCRHFLEKLFESGKYTLTNDQEKIVNEYSKMSHDNWISMVEEFLSKELLKGKTLEKLLSLCSSRNQVEREFAGKGINQILMKHSDVAEKELNTVLEYKYTNDRLRGFLRCDESRLISDDIDIKFVDTLREVIAKNYDIAHKSYKLVAKYLGKKKIEYYERNIEHFIGAKEYKYEDAVDNVINTFTNLDKELGDIVKHIIDNQQIDVYPKKSKRGGAFCTGLDKLPTYILLNFTGKVRDMETLAHELGHAVNYELVKKSQDSLNNDTPISMAEVASTFFEDFAMENVISDLSEEDQLSFKLTKIQAEISTIFRQIACYNFEFKLHTLFRERGYLSQREIGDIFLESMKEYTGEYVHYGKGIENWWIYWSHIRNYFYVYSYASGLLISKVLQNMVREDRKNISKVKKILSMGSSKSPKDILLEVGIDIYDKKVWEKGIQEIRNDLDTAEKLFQRIKI